MQIIPAVDVLDGRVVRLHRGDYADVTGYGNDPVATALAWQRAGADLVHMVDLAGALSGRADRGLPAGLAAAGVRFQIGGGLRTVTDVRETLDAGAARAVVGSVAVWDPALLGDMIAAAGADRLVVALDVSAGRAAAAGWQEPGGGIGDVVAGSIAAGARRALVTGIARDGTMAGPDLDLIDLVRRLAPELEVIASGGVGSLDHLRRLAASGISAAIVGKALYEGRFTLPEAIVAAG